MATIETAEASKDFKATGAGVLIPAGSQIIDTLEVSITTGGFAAVTMGAGQFCKAIMVMSRDNADWQLSAQSGGTRYATITTPMAFDIAGVPTQVLFYAKATVNGTLEVILLD